MSLEILASILFSNTADITKYKSQIYEGENTCRCIRQWQKHAWTLFKCINPNVLQRGYTWEITHKNGEDTSNLSIFDISKYVGTILQDSENQFVSLSVAEDIAFCLENQNIAQDDMA